MPDTFRMNDSLPSLYIPYPACGHCGNDVEMDDGYVWCNTCLIEWADVREDAEAKPDSAKDGTDVPCQIVSGSQDAPHDDKTGKHYVPGPPQPCILPSGHEGQHLCPYDVTVTESVSP